MLLNKNHSKYSDAMEILCSLPRSPVRVPFRLIQQDMGYDRQDQVHAQLDKLRISGLHIETANGEPGEGRCVSIGRDSWDVAVIRANEYWDAVNR